MFNENFAFLAHVIKSMIHVRSVRRFNSIVDLAARELGFEYYALIEHGDLRLGAPNIICFQNYPAAWSDTFIGNQLYLQDPVLRACLTTAVGFEWTRVPRMIRLTTHQRSLLRQARREGLGEGYSVPFNVRGERSGSCSLATRRGRDLPRNNLPAAQLLGAFAFQAARRIVRPRTLLEPQRVDLTPRQLDCLVLAGQGKSDGVIAQLLGLSRNTVVRYLEAARTRYGVATRQQLVVAALFDGHIGFPDVITRQ